MQELRVRGESLQQEEAVCVHEDGKACSLWLAVDELKQLPAGGHLIVHRSVDQIVEDYV